MQNRTDDFQLLVRQSARSAFQNNPDNHSLQALRNGLTAAQMDGLIDKITANVSTMVPAIYNDYMGPNAALLPDESLAAIKQKMVANITENSLKALSNEIALIAEENSRKKINYDSIMTLFNNWNIGKIQSPLSKTVDACLDKAADNSIPYLVTLVSDPAAVDPTFLRDLQLNLTKGAEKTLAAISKSPDFPHIDRAKEDLANHKVRLKGAPPGDINNDKAEQEEIITEKDAQDYVVNAVSRAMNVLGHQFEDTLTFGQTREMMKTAQNMLMTYVLEDIGRTNVVYGDPDELNMEITKIVAENMVYMQNFMTLHVELTNTFDNTFSTNASNEEAKETVSALLDTVGNLTATAGDIIADVPSIDHHIPPGKSVEFGHIARGGGAAFAVGSGMSLLAIPAEYALAKLRGEKPPEVTKEKAGQTALKSVGLGLAVAALAVPHIAVILTVTGAAIGALTAAGSAANHYYQKSKLQGLIKELKNDRIPDLQNKAQRALTDLEFLSTLSKKINEGHIFTKVEIDALTAEFNKLKGDLDATMQELQGEMRKLGEAVFTLNKDYTNQASLGSTTGVVTSATYVAGAAMNFAPTLNVVGSALMIASDACSLTYAVGTKLADVHKSDNAPVSQNRNTLFSHQNTGSASLRSSSSKADNEGPEVPRNNTGPK